MDYPRTPAQGRHRFGKKRVPECECTHHFTCGACLEDHLFRARNNLP